MTRRYGHGTGLDTCGPSYLLFQDNTHNVNLGSLAAVDDLPTADFTVEAWINADGYGGANQGSIMSKTGGANGWYFRVSHTVGLVASANFGGGTALSSSGLDDFTADSQWHHVAAVFDSATKTFNLYIDGVEPTYSTQNAGGGAYNVDNAINLHAGNTSLASTYFDGRIGWVRISNNKRYTANFTAPARCTLPVVDANTLVLEIYEGAGATTYDLGSSGSNGTITGAIWGCDCTIEENDPTCDNEIYIANKSNFANITNVYWYDAGTASFSANLQSLGFPQMLFPAVPAAGDYHYVGINTAIANTGPFVSLVYDIGTAQANMGTMTWQYWNGAWVNLTVQDNTSSFSNTGVNSIHWEQPIDWSTTTVNGVTGYWVRCTGSFPGGAVTPPYQQNRYIYTVTWANIEIDKDQINGDLNKLITIQVDNESDAAAGIGAPPFSPRLWANRVLISSRSVSRGSNFTPYINVANEQNHADITVTSLTARSTFFAGTPKRGPAENHIRYNPGGAIVALTDEVQIDLGDTISPEYRGRFQLFMRVYNDTTGGGNPTDFNLQVRMLLGNSDGLPVFTSDTITTINENTPELIYLGYIDITDNSYTNGIDWSDITFIIKIEHTAATNGLLWIYDIIPFPADEWVSDFIDPYRDTSPVPGCIGGQETSDKARLLVDSVTNPKRYIQALLINQTTGTDVFSVYQQAANDRASLTNLSDSGLRSNVRLYFLFESATFDPGSPPDTLYFASKYEIAARIQLTGVGRYLSMRGDR